MLRRMIGMDAEAGRQLAGMDHLRQSIRDILTTPIGSRVMRRDYGSRLPELIDAPLNRETITDIYAATAEALLAWEPRIDLEQVQVESAAPGRVELSVTVRVNSRPEPVTIAGVEVRQ